MEHETISNYVSPLTQIDNRTFVEGYWRDRQNQTKKENPYPWPTSLQSKPWNLPMEKYEGKTLKNVFLSLLNAIEDKLIEDIYRDKIPGHVRFRGFSFCRFSRFLHDCTVKEDEMGLIEFRVYTNEGKLLRWPIGYKHYIDKHDIIPSPFFISTMTVLKY